MTKIIIKDYEIILKEYELNLNNKKKLISDLEKISYDHSWGTGAVFTTPIFRIKAHQQPYIGVKKILLSAYSKEKINHSKLKEVIKDNLGPCALIYRNRKTGELIDTYFLPEAVNGNYKKRKLVWKSNPLYSEPKEKPNP